MKIKEKVLENGIKDIERGLHSLFVLEKAIDLTLAEVNKVVDDWWKDVMNISSTSTRLEELKQKLGGTN